MREERARPLMQRFDELVRQHAALREVFGLIWGDGSGVTQQPPGLDPLVGEIADLVDDEQAWPARQRDAEPPLQDDRGADGSSRRLYAGLKPSLKLAAAVSGSRSVV
jgi:hypothetical protein